MNFLSQLEEKMKSNYYGPAVFNGIALLIMFPISVGTLFSLKFWIVVALLCAAAAAAGRKNG